MQVTLMLQTANLKELEDFIHVMQAFPKLQYAMNVDETIDVLNRRAEALKIEVELLEARKNALVMVVPTPIIKEEQ